MNARLYDPAVGRFLSPDPYVQNPYFSQNYNRYSYCLNNPLRYTDPDGEFILGFTFGLLRGIFTWNKPLKHAWQTGVNETKIMAGLFISDSRKNFWGQAWEIVSRFTWQLPQTLAGNVYANFSNYFGQVDKVNYWGGATVTTGHNWGQVGVTLGSYILGNKSMQADPNNSLFQHEYGHYLQSQEMGWAYFTRVGLPSLMSANGDGSHKYQLTEQDANRRAFLYFNEKVAGFYQAEDQFLYNKNNGIEKGWNFSRNPLDVGRTSNSTDYLDYQNPASRQLLNNLRLSAKWYDFVGWLGGITGALGVGIVNGI